MGKPWGRLYGGTRNHRKIIQLRREFPEKWTCWYVLIDMAIEVDNDGWIHIAPGVPYSFKDLAKEIGIGYQKTLQKFLESLEKMQLISLKYPENSDKNGVEILLNSFKERNFISDVSTPRVQKHRDKQKSGEEKKRFGNVSLKQGGNAPDTDTEQIQNKEKKKPPISPSRGNGRKFPLPVDFGISEAVRKWAAANNYTHLDAHLEAFIDYAKSGGKVYQDWDSAFRRAIRENWGKIDLSKPETTSQKREGCKECGRWKDKCICHDPEKLKEWKEYQAKHGGRI